MLHTENQHYVSCGCRSAGECNHNTFAWMRALDALANDFLEAMKQKLYRKFMEGKSGWDAEDWTMEDKICQLREHIDKGDMVDVANFAMFAWNQQQKGD